MTTKIVDGVAVEMTAEEIAEFDASRTQYPPSTTLTEALERKRAALADLFRENRDGGTTVTISGTPIDLATTHAAQQELREVATKLASGGTQNAVTRSGVPIVFTSALADTCLAAVVDHHSDCNDAEYDHAVALNTLESADPATSPATVDAYDITTGWPA